MVLAGTLAVAALCVGSTVSRWNRSPAARSASVFFEGHAAIPRRLGKITRPALLADPGRPLARRWPQRAGTRLDLAVGLDCAPGRSCAGARTFRIEARDAGSTKLLAERRIAFDASPRWQALSLDWPDLGPAPGELLFTVSPAEGVPSGGAPPVPYWAEPLMVRRRRPHEPNVLLVSLDTLRADRLGCYGYARPTSPALDAFARDAVLFREAISQAPWTTPSHLSLMTSLYPSAHGVTQDFKQLKTFLEGRGDYPSLGPGAVTLAEVLRGHGYNTLALTGGGPMSAEFGHARGFNVYEQDVFKLSDGVRAQLRAWLEQEREAPFFLFFHTYETHAPYMRTELAREVLTEEQADALDALWTRPPTAPGDPVPELLKRLGGFNRDVTSALYDSGIRYADRHVGRLFEDLRELGLYDDTLIIVTSDHGEEFAERDPDSFYDAHCTSVHEELIHVPLLIRLPGRLRRGVEVPAAVELVDVAPTVLELLGLPVPATMQGRSLAALARGERPVEQRWTLSEATCVAPEMKALRGPRLKYIAAFEPRERDRSGAMLWEKLFDLRADPGERRPLDQRADMKRLRAMLASRLEQLRSRAASPSRVSTSASGRDELRERLRSLGYIDE